MHKNKKCKLADHEQKLLQSGELKNVSHLRSTSIWLEACSTDILELNRTRGNSSCQENDSEKLDIQVFDRMSVVYRPMGDQEIQHLVKHNQLPDTQPYQAIIEGALGREYAEKYLTGKKWVDTSPTTVVEFIVPETLVQKLFKLQHKAEDGVLSHGLGFKAGKTLELFNESLASSETTWRIVKVKRR
eukprot:TRINITY_DN8426_c0_g1_i1.p1 TRINITY_DN8426_c0_g1~~TRINITY_DN8426_c0_g1_i1.p1  ORF type:complete len:187 (-),score=28.64 TRINITY_DN8426_c0_g1_i1:93-653(-)